MRFFAGFLVFGMAVSMLSPAVSFAELRESSEIQFPDYMECEHLLMNRGPLERAAFEMHRRLTGKRFDVIKIQGDLLSLDTFGVAHLTDDQFETITAEVKEVSPRSAMAMIGDYELKLSYKAPRGQENKHLIYFRMPPIFARAPVDFRTREQVDAFVIDNPMFEQVVESVDSSVHDYGVHLNAFNDLESYLISKINPGTRTHELEVGVYLPCRSHILRGMQKVQVRMKDMWMCRLPVLVFREAKDLR